VRPPIVIAAVIDVIGRIAPAKIPRRKAHGRSFLAGYGGPGPPARHPGLAGLRPGRAVPLPRCPPEGRRARSAAVPPGGEAAAARGVRPAGAGPRGRGFRPAFPVGRAGPENRDRRSHRMPAFPPRPGRETVSTNGLTGGVPRVRVERGMRHRRERTAAARAAPGPAAEIA